MMVYNLRVIFEVNVIIFVFWINLVIVGKKDFEEIVIDLYLGGIL